jgi:hypothetical protein
MYVEAKKRQARIKQFILIIFLKKLFMVANDYIRRAKAGKVIFWALKLAIMRLLRKFHCKSVGGRHINYIRQSVTWTAVKKFDTELERAREKLEPMLLYANERATMKGKIT